MFGCEGTRFAPFAPFLVDFDNFGCSRVTGADRGLSLLKKISPHL
jgi:hypothetical protein